MKNFVFIIALVITSCFSLQSGPEPHSIEYKETEFNKVISYFKSNPNTEGFKLENAQNIPDSVLENMKEIGVLEFRNLGNYKVFFCGYGVVGKGWGFIYGDFNQKEIELPEIIEGNDDKMTLTFLEHIEGNWYRFGA